MSGPQGKTKVPSAMRERGGSVIEPTRGRGGITEERPSSFALRTWCGLPQLDVDADKRLLGSTTRKRRSAIDDLKVQVWYSAAGCHRYGIRRQDATATAGHGAGGS